MAPFAFAVTKRITWRGQPQEFSNVYHFDIADPGSFNFEDRLLQLRTQEVVLHAANVNFVQGRAWGPTNQGQAASTTRAIVDWSNIVGAAASNTSFYRELAFMIYWPLGRYGSKNRPQFLRKWLHLCTPFGIGGSTLTGSDPITTTPAEITTYIANISQMGGFCGPNGHTPISSGKLYPYLEHRQLGR